MSSHKNALLSVYDKTWIAEFARGLNELGWTIYASGGTAKEISRNGIEVIDVAILVGGEAILGHRVVTLSREIAAGLLADINNPDDINELSDLNIPIIELVCVDMYPLEQEINKDGSSKSEVIDKTDIGGPTLLRAAAKGRRIVLSHASQREAVLSRLKNGDESDEAFRDELAARAEYEVARYVLSSAKYLNGQNISGQIHSKLTDTKYGENPWQTEAALYADNRINSDSLSLDKFEHIQGMDKSFINITDIDRLLQTVTHIAAGFDQNFSSVPFIAVGVKHGNACGAGVGDSFKDAAEKMLMGDTRAIFGGVVMINGPIDKEVAETLMHFAMDGDRARLLDGVIGSAVSEEALQLLSRNKLRVVINPELANLSKLSLDSARRIRPVRGGVLEQPNYTFVIDLNEEYMQLHGELTEGQKKDLLMGWAIGSTSNSNTICIVKNGTLIGNGVGQQDRVGAGQLAITRSTNLFPEMYNEEDKRFLKVALDKDKLAGASAYSDSFFPFPDGPELLAKAGIKAILTSSGSIADEQVVSTLTALGVSVLMVPDKIGRGFYTH